MIAENPHYLLFSEASLDPSTAQIWRFVLQNVESQRRFSATDSEPAETGHERLELLAVVRGLEALDRPARVTLVTKSRYVSRGMKHGLSAWRSNNWLWERFGRVVPVRDHDLWRRVDQALRFHRIDCQAWQFDEPATEETPAESRSEPSKRQLRPRVRRRRPTKAKWSDRLSDVWSSVARPLQRTIGTTG
jgi:ribonuclease HI